ncbi:MAG: membrane bound O-acyl transferase family-domain-containing protein, partial [Bdellovibrionota bacterium]
LVWNYVALFGFLMILHLGLVEVHADALRLLGFAPKTLFDRPFLAKSLQEFWSRRWNLAFVDMNKIFLLGPLKVKLSTTLLVLSIFAVSGLLHELAISYPDGVSWGSPLTYFLIQGVGMLAERKVKFPRAAVLLWILLPIPLLFTPAFTNLFFGALGAAICGFVTSLAYDDWIRFGLVAGGTMHVLVLGASFQVPSRLAWKEEFQRLRPLNRKVVWTYGAYILAIIVFMGTTSFYLASSGEVSSGPGKLWVVFIALFWWARISIDFLYMKHEDWPRGPLFEIGHVCLATLFVTMTLTYTGLAILLLGGTP